VVLAKCNQDTIGAPRRARWATKARREVTPNDDHCDIRCRCPQPRANQRPSKKKGSRHARRLTGSTSLGLPKAWDCKPVMTVRLRLHRETRTTVSWHFRIKSTRAQKHATSHQRLILCWTRQGGETASEVGAHYFFSPPAPRTDAPTIATGWHSTAGAPNPNPPRRPRRLELGLG
jgi:hypothetical protein